MRCRLGLALLVVGWLASIQPIRADSYTFTTIDVPGSNSTEATGINDMGEVVGTYTDSSGSHGFSYQNGLFSPINVPGSTGTSVSGVNNLGQIVGSISAAGTHGFLDTNGLITTLDFPGSFGTQAFGINNVGQIVGIYLPTPQAVLFTGLTYSNGVFTALPFFPGSNFTFAQDINDAGEIVGFPGFLYINGTFNPINVPDSTFTHALGINDLGQIVGSFGDANNVPHGFLDIAGVFTTLNVPGASTTTAGGINESGTIVGYYTDSSGNFHGFLATPVPEPASLALVAFGLVSAVGLLRFCFRNPGRCSSCSAPADAAAAALATDCGATLDLLTRISAASLRTDQ